MSGRFTGDSGQMGTTIKGSSDFSVNRGCRLENCTNNFSGFRNIDPRERVVPAVEKTPHQSESTLAGQRVDQLLDPNGVGAESPSSVLWREPISEGAQKKAVAADRDTISSQAAEEDLIHRILSGHRELFMDLIHPHQRTFVCMSPCLPGISLTLLRRPDTIRPRESWLSGLKRRS